MSFFDGSKSIFQITDVGSTLRDLSQFINAVNGLPGPRALNIVTGLADAGAKRHPGIEDISFSLAGTFDDTADSGPDAVLGPLRTHTAAVAFDYGPEGKTGSDVKYSGDCWVSEYLLVSQVGSVVSWTANLEVEGIVARGTY